MQHKLGLIGAGNMGAAIARGAIRKGVVAPGDLIVADVDPAKLAEFEQTGCGTSVDPLQAAAAQQIILAVKPQSFPLLAKAIAARVGSKLVVSIMAGIRSEHIRAALGGSARIVRAMPNTPCQIGAGITAIALGAGAQTGDESTAVQLFEALGRTVMVDESQMHAVTAISGSGPAYVFLLAEAMEQAAQELGIDSATARLLVEHTVAGAGRLMVETGQTASQLRQAVTSPGGTTAAALEVMFESELPETIAEALLAARNRGMELDQA